jgi:dihydropteroate synthase
MAEEGADIIDIGGESTRPGSKPLELEEELRRVIPVIESLAKGVDVPISIDTYKSAVAKRAIEAGAEIINDISGLHFDPTLAQIAAKEDTPLILMHIRGIPETMQKNVHYDSLFSEILRYLIDSIQRAESAGLDPQQVIVDPGIGFGPDHRRHEQGHFIGIVQGLDHDPDIDVLVRVVVIRLSNKEILPDEIFPRIPAHRLDFGLDPGQRRQYLAPGRVRPCGGDEENKKAPPYPDSPQKSLARHG